MVEYELFLYKGQPYCHWVDNGNEHKVNLLEGGRGFFWSSFPCAGKDRVMYYREDWDILPLFHTLAWKNFGVGYYLTFTSEEYSNPDMIEPDMFKTIFYEKLSIDMGAVYIDHLGQFRNYGGVIHFDRVEFSCNDPVFWLDGFTAEVVKDMLS